MRYIGHLWLILIVQSETVDIMVSLLHACGQILELVQGLGLLILVCVATRRGTLHWVDWNMIFLFQAVLNFHIAQNDWATENTFLAGSECVKLVLVSFNIAWLETEAVSRSSNVNSYYSISLAYIFFLCAVSFCDKDDCFHCIEYVIIKIVSVQLLFRFQMLFCSTMAWLCPWHILDTLFLALLSSRWLNKVSAVMKSTANLELSMLKCKEPQT
jgi:hypothetical protein